MQTPRWNDDHGNHREDRLQFKTTITLSEDQRGAIDGLETDLVNTSHFVVLDKSTAFETIKLTGSNGAIVVKVSVVLHRECFVVDHRHRNSSPTLSNSTLRMEESKELSTPPKSSISRLLTVASTSTSDSRTKRKELTA